jgi:hypothetical protein
MTKTQQAAARKRLKPGKHGEPAYVPADDLQAALDHIEALEGLDEQLHRSLSAKVEALEAKLERAAKIISVTAWWTIGGGSEWLREYRGQK